MTNIKRLMEVLSGLIMILFGVLLFYSPESAYLIVVSTLSLTFAAIGLRNLFYYFTMARYMVNGRLILYKGIILLDFGLLTASFIDVPRIYLILYLAIIHAFSGAVEILRAMEARRYGARSWKLKFSHGIINLSLAICCLAFIKMTNLAIYIYAAGLIYSAIIRIITAFRRTTLVFIQ